MNSPGYPTPQVPSPPDFRLLFESAPGLFLVLTPDLKIVAVSDAYLRATMTRREEILGKGLFVVFPDNPDDVAATGVNNLRASLNRVLSQRIPDTMAVQKYDIRRPESEGGAFEIRYWSPVNYPVLSANNEVAYIIHRVEDVTEFVRLRDHGAEQERTAQRLQIRGEEMEAEIFLRAQEIQEANKRLREANDELTRFQVELEQRVHDRTTQLAQANEALRRENLVRQQAEETLRTSEERFRLMIDGVKDYAIFMLDVEGHIVSWNTGAERILGYHADEVVGTSYARFFTPEDLAVDAPRHELDRARAEGYFDATGWRIRKDGTRFWANGILTTLYDGPDNIRGFAKITRDLTEQHQAAQALMQLAAIVASSDDSIIGLNLDGTIESWNPASERMYGYSAGEAIGQPFQMLVLPERAERLRERITRLSHGEHIEPIETVRIRKDGQRIEIISKFSPILDSNGTIVGVSSFSRDITERRKLEAQLQQSQKMEAFGQLAGGVAHDFNNLLTVIGGFSEMLLMQFPKGDSKRSLLEEIHRAGERAASLTRQLLAFSRQQVLEPKVLNLNTVVAEIERLLRRLIGEDMRMTAVLAPDLALVKVDPGQIEQVIMNLAVNARDAMPQGGQFTIETQNVNLDDSYCLVHPEVKPGAYVLLAATDTGTGIPPEIKARIFEPFFTTKGVGKGTGLGLSVVQGIVKQSGGSIEVYSEIGTGTTFKIYLPVVIERLKSPSHQGLIRSTAGTETILLVEDEDAVRELSALALKSNGYKVIMASSGPEALAIMESRTEMVDLLVTDVVMPEMSGAKLAEILQTRSPGLKALFLSGYTDDAIFRHGILHDKVSFLQKPFTATSLNRKVREVLDKP